MPIPFIYEAVVVGIPWLPSLWNLAKVGALVFLIAAVKWYSQGAICEAESKMHSKVIMITVPIPLL